MKKLLISIALLALCHANTLMAATQDVAESESMHEVLKTKFIEGNPMFMSLVALALIIGLTFCIERIIYLALADINTKKFMATIEKHIMAGEKEKALDHCRNTRGPVASICFQGILHSEDSLEEIDRTVASFADVEVGKLEKGCSWITLFIAIAPSLGFLGTVIGMVMSFDDIEMSGDISPTIVAGGMKVALITTIFGIIVAVVLQIFYNYILSRIEHLTSQMEQASIDLLEILKAQK